MITDLTLENLYITACEEQEADELATHLLCAQPDDQCWALVSLRSSLSIALAIRTPKLQPVALLSTVEMQYFSHVEDFPLLEAHLLQLLAERPDDVTLISFLDAWNSMCAELLIRETPNGLPEQP